MRYLVTFTETRGYFVDADSEEDAYNKASPKYDADETPDETEYQDHAVFALDPS